MIDLIFPDGSQRQFDDGVTGREVAASIAKSLEKKAVLVKLAGELRDLDRPLDKGGAFEILTRESPEALETIRHDASHVMAEAVQELFPGTQVTIGPAIDDGFYYDFARETPFSLDDLATIEQRMKEIVDRDEKIVREVWDRDEAIAHFKSIGEAYKAEIISDLPAGETITVYRQGNWKDLCLGPHLPSTKSVGKAFKLMKLAGAYWRGDHRNAQLQRIYGTAWASEADLEAHLHRLEEAERRDHRKIGRAMDLFHLQEEAKGMIFWHPKGWTLYRTVEAYMRRRLDVDGYVEVKAPQIMDRALWEKSGHWEKFGANMFTCETAEGEELAVKPMNCPGHVQIFNFGQKSYRDLPLRMAEFGACHRFEPSGALHGIMRLRAFTQDDAHIFCREDQIEEETTKFVRLLNSVYADFGLELDSVKLALRPDLRAGTDETWDIAEDKLDRAARQAVNMEVERLPGEGAFYGPKLEFHLSDAIGRTWQCGTLQLDFVLPERLDAEYVVEDGSKQRPVMLHRAICGSMERFIGVVIENYAGAFPLWLAPTQVVVATITSDADDYALQVAQELSAAGLRVETDLRNEKINYKIREHSLAKAPVIAVVGRREAEEGKVALRRFGSDGQSILTVEEAVKTLALEASPPDVARQRVLQGASPEAGVVGGQGGWMNGIAAPIVAYEPAPTQDYLKPRRSVSVVMVVYMTGEALQQSIECVLADPLVDELVIVDNGSTRMEASRIKRLADSDRQVRLLQGHGNVGFARGANLGAQAAASDVIVFLNPDAFLQPGCVAELVRAIEGRPVPTLVGGRVLNADRTEQRGARRGDITPVSALLSLSHLSRRVPAWRRYEVHWETETAPEGVIPVPTISGACFCMRREDFDIVQGFDEGYFLHVEDVDLCWRVRQTGGAVLFQPKAEVIHLGHTSHASPLRVEFHKGVGLARYFRKRAEGLGERLLALILSPIIVCTAIARPMMWRIRGRAA